MKHVECPGTLLARSRRYALSPTDLAALDAHLRTCECCRQSQQVMLDFDEDAISERHDGARIHRLAAFVRQRVSVQQVSVQQVSVQQASVQQASVQQAPHLVPTAPMAPGPSTAPRPRVAPELHVVSPMASAPEPMPAFGFWARAGSWAGLRLPKRARSSGQRHAGMLLTAAAIFLVVAGASGAILVQRVVRDQDLAAQRAVFRDELGAPVAERARQIAEVALPNVDEEKVASILGEYDTSHGTDDHSADAAVSQPTSCAGSGCGVADASTLFKQANAARREGRSSVAIALYQQLQRIHPSSAEAQLSHLSLGHLLLANGNASQASSQFNAALRSAGASSVKAEALYGKGLALGRLGRSSEERSTWRRLLSEFESSPYAAHAKRRLSSAP